MAHTDPVKRVEYNRQYREKRREVLAAKERERYASGGKERQKVYRQKNLDQYASTREIDVWHSQKKRL